MVAAPAAEDAAIAAAMPRLRHVFVLIIVPPGFDEGKDAPRVITDR